MPRARSWESRFLAASGRGCRCQMRALPRGSWGYCTSTLDPQSSKCSLFQVRHASWSFHADNRPYRLWCSPQRWLSAFALGGRTETLELSSQDWLPVPHQPWATGQLPVQPQLRSRSRAGMSSSSVPALGCCSQAVLVRCGLGIHWPLLEGLPTPQRAEAWVEDTAT